MSGGSVENNGTGILSRHREIGELDEELKALKLSEKTVDRDITGHSNNIAGIDADIASVENDIKELELEKIKDESHLAQVEENMRKLSARLICYEKEQLDRQAAENNQKWKNT